MKPFSEALRAPIANLEEAKAWIRALVAAEMTFHLEDDPGDIYVHATGANLFDEAEAEIIRERVAELYGLEWGPQPGLGRWYCPIGFMIREEFLASGVKGCGGEQAAGFDPGADEARREGDLVLIDFGDCASREYSAPGRFQVWRDAATQEHLGEYDTLEEAEAALAVLAQPTVEA